MKYVLLSLSLLVLTSQSHAGSWAFDAGYLTYLSDRGELGVGLSRRYGVTSATVASLGAVAGWDLQNVFYAGLKGSWDYYLTSILALGPTAEGGYRAGNQWYVFAGARANLAVGRRVKLFWEPGAVASTASPVRFVLLRLGLGLSF